MKSEVKRILICGVLLGAMHSASFAQDTLCIGTSEWAGTVRLEYFVSTNDLHAPAAWDPDRTPFPRNLGNLVRAAEGFLSDAHQLDGTVQHPASWFGPVNIDISQIPPRTLSGKYLVWATNQWAIRIRFMGKFSSDWDALHPPAKKIVVMLPDGTHAAEKLVQSRKARVVVTNSLPQPLVEPGMKPKRHVSEAVPDSQSWSTLPICPVQWDPLTQEFPLDLKLAVSRAKEHLVSLLGANESLDLKFIELSHYEPIETLEAAKLPASQHQHHWILVFTYGPRLCNVQMLLDGTILPNSNKPSRTLRSADN